MTDVNKLRRLAETVQSPAYNINERMDALNNLHNVLSSGVVLELLDRLESTEVDNREQARLNGMGASREAALMAKLEAAVKEVAHIKEVEFPRKAQAVADAWEGKCKRLEAERDALRAALQHETDCLEAAKAKIERMEQQEPIAYMPLVTVAQLESGGSGVVWCPHDRSVSDVPVYALPGAQTQGEEK